MATFAQRLNEALRLRGMTAAELSRKLGINEGTVSQYKKGLYEPKQKRTEAIAEALGVSVRWLLGADVPASGEPVPSAENLIPLKKIKTVPILGRIACGEPILAAQNYEGSTLLPEGVNADFALKCSGDSMIDANICDGDLVFIRETPEVQNGEIAAVVIGDEATLKKVYVQGSTVTLIPANSAYEPIVCQKEELNSIRICGKAVAVLRIL